MLDQQKAIVDHLKAGVSKIVYSSTIKQAAAVQSCILEKCPDSHLYHSQLSAIEKQAIEDQFSQGLSKTLVTTKAFSLGIHIDDVGVVVHAGLPLNIEQYLQESGRGGRDGSPCQSYVFYTSRDIHLSKFMLNLSYPDTKLLADVYQKLDENLQIEGKSELDYDCLLYTSPSPRDATLSRMPSSA